MDDAHEGFKAHVDAARLMYWRGCRGLFGLYHEARLIGAVGMAHDGHAGRLGWQVSCPAQFHRADLGQGEESPFAAVRVLDLETCGLGELGGLFAVPAAFEPRQASAPLPTCPLVGDDACTPGLVLAEEVLVRLVRMPYGLLQRCGGHGREPRMVGIVAVLGEHGGQLVVGLHPAVASAHEFTLFDRPIVGVAARAEQAHQRTALPLGRVGAVVVALGHAHTWYYTRSYV